MSDPRQPVLDHLAILRRERWKMVAWFGGLFALGFTAAVMCIIWAVEGGHYVVWALLALFNAWEVAEIPMLIRRHWVAIRLMERHTRALLALFDRLRLDNDKQESHS